MMRRVLSLMVCGTILALTMTACSAPTPAFAPTPPKRDAVRPAGAKTPDGGVPAPTTPNETTPTAVEHPATVDQDVNARIERVENGLIEVTTKGGPLWDFKRALAERMELYGVPGVSIAVEHGWPLLRGAP